MTDQRGVRCGPRLPAVALPTAAGRSSCSAPCRSWPSGCSSGGGSPRRSDLEPGLFRFWIVKTLVRPTRWSSSSVHRSTSCTSGRWGPSIGQGVLILSRNVPIAPTCSPLATAPSSARTLLTCYRAHAGLIQTGHGHSARMCWSARCRCSTSTPRWATGPSSATRPPCTPGRPCRTENAGMGLRPSPRPWTTGRLARPVRSSSGGWSPRPGICYDAVLLTSRWRSAAWLALSMLSPVA